MSRMLARHLAERPASRAWDSEGSSMAIKTAMMATTTSSSISVKALRCLVYNMAIPPRRVANARLSLAADHICAWAVTSASRQEELLPNDATQTIGPQHEPG